ncbi:hypothetical protein UFOVP377_33 [uncultured Caudovirales phage]|uniref:Uncharacterized protein n=1 Tax=uncultured Caudovirales phage TaxID=2100421 RepID=A0A6J7WYG6_9CAUD|nr:hypothetical protein UFOVP377_33 [uncultured Caudovirales phage]
MTGFKSKRESSIGRFAIGNDSKRRVLGLAGEWSAREKLPGEAQPPAISIWRQPVYQPPKMDTPRPGAHDHLKVRSRGV